MCDNSVTGLGLGRIVVTHAALNLLAISSQPSSDIQLPMLGPLQGLQSNNNQQQNQHQQQGNQQNQQQAGQQNNIPPPPPQNGQDFTLSSVLHFLQTEWRRYERDRNEWEIERAEMRVSRFCLFLSVAFLTLHTQARIALLEGERRSFENVKLDLMRRIKMLEYALRMERSGVIPHIPPRHSLTCLRPPAQNNSPNLLHKTIPLRNLRLSKAMPHYHPKRMTLKVIKRIAAAAPHGARVRLEDLYHERYT